MGLDGFFLKGATNGELQCAVGKDTNNQMFLLHGQLSKKRTMTRGAGSMTYCSEIYRLALGKTGCSPLINRRYDILNYLFSSLQE